jgi:membrane protein DedA with SNARE-associated domain
MSAHEITAALAIGATFGALLAYPLGYYIGKAKGVALGWQEAFFEQVEKEKAKRGKDGRFTRKVRK